MNKIFEYKNRGTRKGNIYYLIDDDTIEIEIENNNNEKVRCIIDKEDFDKVKVCNWKFRRDCQTFYACNSRNGMIHRLIMNCPDDMKVDHINGNGLDNRKSNLKIVTDKQNSHNFHHSRGRTGILGVVFEGGRSPRYRAVWNENGKMKTKSFSISKHGDKAEEMAIQHREFIKNSLYKDIYNGVLPKVMSGDATSIVDLNNN